MFGVRTKMSIGWSEDISVPGTTVIWTTNCMDVAATQMCRIYNTSTNCRVTLHQNSGAY
jgi:hypothetical protein